MRCPVGVVSRLWNLCLFSIRGFAGASPGFVGGFSPPTPLGRTGGPAPIAKNLIFCSCILFRHLSTRGSTEGFPPERSRECRGRTMGLPFARQTPEQRKTEILNFGDGLGARSHQQSPGSHQPESGAVFFCNHHFCFSFHGIAVSSFRS